MFRTFQVTSSKARLHLSTAVTLSNKACVCPAAGVYVGNVSDNMPYMQLCWHGQDMCHKVVRSPEWTIMGCGRPFDGFLHRLEYGAHILYAKPVKPGQLHRAGLHVLDAKLFKSSAVRFHKKEYQNISVQACKRATFRHSLIITEVLHVLIKEILKHQAIISVWFYFFKLLFEISVKDPITVQNCLDLPQAANRPLNTRSWLSHSDML